MGILRQALLAVALIALTGCSYFFGDEGQFRERAMDYQEAESIPPLNIPEGAQAKELRQRYPIPEVAAPEAGATAYVPEASDALPRPHSPLNVDEAAGLELRQDDGRYWLNVSSPVVEVWPRMVGFVEGNLFAVGYENQSEGVVESGWLKPRRLPGDDGWWKSFKRFFTGGDKDKRERFRFEIDPSQDYMGSVITINHIKTGAPTPDTIEWPQAPANPELMALVYDELMSFLSEGGRKVGASVLSQNLEALPKHTMTWDGNGFPILVINQDFNHAWRDVGTALQRAKIGVQDLDRSLGIYYLDRTAVVKDDDGDEEKKDVQLRLVSSESGIQVSVQLDDDTVAPKDLSAEILLALREQLR